MTQLPHAGPNRLVATVLVAAAVALAPGCGAERPAAPVVTGIEPAAGPPDLATPVVIQGEGFGVRVVTRFDDQGASEIDDTYRARLGDVELQGVTRTGDGTLTAVVPKGLPPGAHALTVIDPWQQEGTLAAAFRVATRPAALAFTSLPQTVPIGACSEPVTVELRDAEGRPTAALTELALSLVADPGVRFVFHADDACNAPVASVRIPAGELSATFRFAGGAAGVVTVTASAAGVTPAAQDETIGTGGPYLLAFTSAPQVLGAGDCSQPLALQVQDAAGNPAPMAVPVGVTLAAEPPGGVSIFSDAGCGAPASSATIAAGSSTTAFHGRGVAVGVYQLRAEATGFGAAAQELTVVPGAAVVLAVGAIASPQFLDVPFPVTLRAVDGAGNTTPAFTGPASLSASGATLACVTGCVDATTTTTFVDGAWAGEVTLAGTPRTGVTVTATGGGLSGTSNAFDLDALPPARSPPIARLRRSPAAVAAGQSVSFDAAASEDIQTAAAALEVSWDLTGTASGAPPWTPWSTAKTTTTTYAAPGTYSARVAVRDADGDVGYADARVVVVAAGELCTVTTDTDRDDRAVDCTTDVGRDGFLSLTEALRITEALPGEQVITFSPPLLLANPRAGSIELRDDVALVAPPGVVLQAYPLRVVSGTARIVGLELTALPSALQVAAGATLRLDGVSLHDSPGLAVEGTLDVDASGFEACGTGGGACVQLQGGQATARVARSTFFDMGRAIRANGCGAAGLVVETSLFVRAGTAVDHACQGPLELTHSTFFANATGLVTGGGAGHVLRNVIFSGQTQTAASCGGASFSARDHNVLDGNASDGCLAGDPDTILGAAGFLVPWRDDLRLAQGSPAVDSAVDLGKNVNGAAPGNFLGLGPDRGGLESW